MGELKWPFYIEYLSQALDTELIQYIQSGISARMNRAFNIVEFCKDKCHFIPPIDPTQNWSDFCKFLRQNKEEGGLRRNGGCLLSDRDRAVEVVNSDSDEAIDYLCWMELSDFAAPVLFQERKIAVIFTGQFVYEGTTEYIKEYLSGKAAKWNERNPGSISDEQIRKAHEYIDGLDKIDDEGNINFPSKG